MRAMNKVEKILRGHREWIANSGGRVARELRLIKDDLADCDMVGLDNVSDSLGRLANYYGIKGNLALRSGEAAACDEISRSINYRYWALRLRAKSFSNTAFLRGVKSVPDLTGQLSNASCLLAAFISIDRRDLAESVADILEGMLSIDGVVDAEYLARRKFEYFMLWLYSVYSGGECPLVTGLDLGVYQGVLDSWECSEGLSRVMMSLCAYHLENSDDDGGDWDPEFKNPPFDLLAFEIKAISVVRQKRGLPSNEPQHELLSVPSSSIEGLSVVSDEISDEVEAAYHCLYG